MNTPFSSLGLRGATGYISSAVSASLNRSGDHTVYDLASSPQKATQLSKQENLLVSGSVIEANNKSLKILEDLIKAGKERLHEYEEVCIKGPKLGFVCTSKAWVHGSSHERTSDLETVGASLAKAQAPRLVAWRPKLEQAVLAASNVLDTMIIRLALVYGREHTIWTSVFGPILEVAKAGNTQPVRLHLNPHDMLGLIQVDDVATGIHAAVDKLPLTSGTSVYPVFDIVVSKKSMRDITEAAACIFEFKGIIELVGPGDDIFGEAMGSSFNGDAKRVRQLLGWSAKKVGFVSNMDVYASIFAAAYEK
ncbi:MAG: hypothetical protein M1830_007626 [Pleopsidium flavum]|nr:MAG: hypothetical protein M1830_007626 [Pleopsidium flavum]